MSVNLMSAIFETEFRDLKDEKGDVTKASTAKLVLLAMADHANDEGEGAYPAIEKLCRKTALSDQTIRNTFDALRYNGIISLVGKSKYGTNNHSINTKAFPKAIGKEVPVLTLYPLDPQMSTVEGSNEYRLPPNPLDPNHHITTNKTSEPEKPKPSKAHKKGDIFDYLTQEAKDIENLRIDETENVLIDLEKILRRNFSRSTEWQGFAKWLLRQTAEGRGYKVWASWYMQEPFRAAWTWKQTRATFEASYPQAFIGKSNAAPITRDEHGNIEAY